MTFGGGSIGGPGGGGGSLPPTLSAAGAKQLRAALELFAECMSSIAPIDRQVLSMRAGGAGAAPLSRPQVRWNSPLAYDSSRGRVVMFGGTDSSASRNLADTWEWDGTNWIQRAPATSPTARAGHAMAYDSIRGRVVLFGGSGDQASPIWPNAQAA